MFFTVNFGGILMKSGERKETLKGEEGRGKPAISGGLAWAGIGFHDTLTTALIFSPTVAGSRLPPCAHSFLLPHNQSPICITVHNKDYICHLPF